MIGAIISLALCLPLILFFVVVPVAIGQIGGWAALGREYRLAGRFDGPRWWFQDLALRRWCNYSGCVSIGANADGIYLNTVFWLCHPPLFIPWSELSATRRDVSFFGIRIGLVDFVTQRVPQVPITLRESVIKKIALARPTDSGSEAKCHPLTSDLPAEVAQ